MNSKEYGQQPLFAPENPWTPPDHNLPGWKNAKRVAIDCETRDPNLKTLGPSIRTGGYIVGVSFAIEDGPAYYLPVRHGAGGNLDEGKVFRYLKKQAKEFTGQIVGANLPYDLDYLAEAGVVFRKATFLDVQVAAPLLWEHHLSYSLDNIAKRYGYEGKDTRLLDQALSCFGKGNQMGNLWKLHSMYVGPYATEDARLPLKVLRRQEKEIEREGLQRVFELESKVLPVLVKMRRRGIRLDLDRLAQIEEETLAREKEMLQTIWQSSGMSLSEDDLWKADALAKVLGECGIEVGTTDEGRPSVTKAFLKEVNTDVSLAIMEARRVNKIRTTFVASVNRYRVNDRLHPTYNQLKKDRDAGGAMAGTISGRLSSQDLNLQQQIGTPYWRSIFLPEEGETWASIDYASQEPRLTCHYASGAKCWRADEFAQAWRDNPRLDIYPTVADLANVIRKTAKTIFLGLGYGMGGGKMCDQLGLPKVERFSARWGKQYWAAGEEGQAIIDAVKEAVPWVKELSDMCQAKAEERGWIRTLGGRVLHFEEDKKEGGYRHTYAALNRLIQGSAADQTKQALVDIDAAGLKPRTQVHDEIGGSFKTEHDIEQARHFMENSYDLLVPTVVDVEAGKSWGHSMLKEGETI